MTKKSTTKKWLNKSVELMMKLNSPNITILLKKRMALLDTDPILKTKFPQIHISPVLK